MNFKDLVVSGLANKNTTAVGFGLSGLTYVGNVGLKLPNNQSEWFSFGVSLLIAILGLLTKDSTVGSQPK